MSTQGPRPVLGLLLVLSGLVPAGADAAAAAGSNSNKNIAYRWVDEQGVVHYGDRVPPQYVEKERALLNSQGVVVGHLDAQKTPEQIASETRAHEEARKQKQHDSFLVTTYTSVKDIEALRDVRLDQLQGQQVAAEQYVDNLRSRLTSLQTRARLFRPYAVLPNARKMPDDLAEDLVRTLNELRTQSGVLVAKGEEVAALRAQFQMDIERYRELHDGHNRH
jgi:Domain of unknown function (DUF4124)